MTGMWCGNWKFTNLYPLLFIKYCVYNGDWLVGSPTKPTLKTFKDTSKQRVEQENLALRSLSKQFGLSIESNRTRLRKYWLMNSLLL